MSDNQDDALLVDSQIEKAKTNGKNEFRIDIRPNGNIKNLEITKQDEMQQKPIFTMKIKEDIANKKIILNYTLSVENARSVRQIVSAYKIYLAFLEKKLYINNVKLFNGIIKGTVEDEDYTFDIEEAKKAIEYWEKIVKLEKRLKVKFKPQLPLNRENSIFLDELCRSFIEKKPYRFNGLPNSVEIVDTNMEVLEEDVKSLGSFSLIMHNHPKDFWGVKLNLWQVTHIYKVKIKEYEKLADLENAKNRVKLYFESLDDTIVAMMYFSNEEDAQLNLANGEKWFANAKLL